tara:strand:+ start:1795 stop:2373 length:579 start_codon:yes stop_codon:yes gene_type:complete
MTKLFKGLKMPNIKIEHVVLFVIGVLFLYYLIKSYNSSKSGSNENMSSRKVQDMYNQANAGESTGSDMNVQPAAPLGENETYQSVSGMSSSQGLPPSCSKEPVADPSELLPKDTNSQWSQLNPSGSGDLQNVNLLRAGFHQGIDTVGNSLRNPNLQVRSEPSNPQVNVGPWNNTTISPDTMRVPLEIGQGPQ